MRFQVLLLMGLAFVTATADAQVVNRPPIPEWIAAPENTVSGSTYFFRVFDAPAGLLKAILLGAADGRAVLYLNGQAAGEFAGRTNATSLDVTRHIRPGRNQILLKLTPATNDAAVSVLLELNGDLARLYWVASDAQWQMASGERLESRSAAELGSLSTLAVRSLGKVDVGGPNPFDPKGAFDAYNSWKLALATNAATDPSGFTLLPGFSAQLVRSAQAGEGSWVALAFDPQGRLTLAREKRGLLRLTLHDASVSQVEVINDTLLECRGLLYAYGSLYANANNTKALFRLRDEDGDDRFDSVEELLRTEGGVGHGRNHLKLGPDGYIYIAHGNNVLPSVRAATNSPLRHYREDQLSPCPWDPGMFDGDVLVPAGHVVRLDRDAREVELWAGGFRNALDVAFNEEGEMFTFDADMEWDVGAPWYMPNRVLHVVSGSDFGFRRGTGRFPAWYADTWPAVCDIGLASPTAVTFGTGSAFPEKYRRALFICDWAYGRVLAVHLSPVGSTYRGESELFLAGRPLNVTDICIGPDGAMWLTTGGRGTQSGLYRITYHGTKSLSVPHMDAEADQARTLRRRLERFHGMMPGLEEAAALTEIWPQLNHPDRFVRQAARVALETIPPARWRQQALSETDSIGKLTAWLALARVGEASDRDELLHRLNGLSWVNLAEEEKLTALRVYSLAFARMGAPDPELGAACRTTLEPSYPATSQRLNHELCELLVYLKSPEVVAKTIPLIDAAESSEDLLQYTFCLRQVREGWNSDLRRRYFAGLKRAENFQGARQYFKALRDTREDALALLTPAEREVVAPTASRSTVPALRPTVKEWTLADLVPRLLEVERGRSHTNGLAALHAAQCLACHRIGTGMATVGSTIGPDLTDVAGRFNRRDLLEQILDPSKVIDEKFQQTLLTLEDGREITGAIEREEPSRVVIRPNPLADATIEVSPRQVRERRKSSLSPMPSGLLNGLTAEEILDLLAFLTTSGRAEDARFRGGR